jgi:serine/threonine protein kinase
MTTSRTVGSLWTGPRDDPRHYRVDLTDEGLVSIGDGGEGLVYRAVGVVDGVTQDVALKMLTSLTLDDYDRVAKRAAIVAEIRNPHVMRQIETFVGTALIDEVNADEEEFEILYTVADWVPGEPLADALAKSELLAGFRWVGQVARAVNFLHSYRGPGAPDGIIHRDIKPSNVRVTPDDKAVLIDFGVARPQSDTDLTDRVGTYLWRAPEVVGGPGTPGLTSDNWGIGALAYWVLIGEPPRLEGAAAARDRLLHTARQAELPDPDELSGHIAALLETHPDDRPSDLLEWADDLEVVANGTGRSRSLIRHSRRGWSRRIAVIAAAIVILLGTIIGVVVGSLGSPGSYTTARYAFRPQTYPSGLSVDRSWTLSGATGNVLRGVVTLDNTSATTVNTFYDEVLPKSVAPNLSHMEFVPAPTKIIRDDPVVGYDIDLGVGASTDFSYVTDIGPTSGSWYARLVGLVKDQEAAQAAYLKSTSRALPVSLASLTMTPASLEMTVGQKRTLDLTGTMTNKTPAPTTSLDGIDWSSPNSRVAQVANGVVYAIGTGTTTITAQAGPLKANVAVDVAKAPDPPSTTLASSFHRSTSPSTVGPGLGTQAHGGPGSPPTTAGTTPLTSTPISTEPAAPPPSAYAKLKVCDIAGSSALIGEYYSFTEVAGKRIVWPFSVQAEPAGTDLNCGGQTTYSVGTNVLISEAPSPDAYVSSVTVTGGILISGDYGTEGGGSVVVAVGGIGTTTVNVTNETAGPPPSPGYLDICQQAGDAFVGAGPWNFTISGNGQPSQTEQVLAGQCSGDVSLPIGDYTVTEGFSSPDYVSSITGDPTAPVSTNLANGSGVFAVSTGTTETATFTNDTLTSQIKVSKTLPETKLTNRW